MYVVFVVVIRLEKQFVVVEKILQPLVLKAVGRNFKWARVIDVLTHLAFHVRSRSLQRATIIFPAI